MDVDGVGQADEEIEKRTIVDGFGNLGVGERLDELVQQAVLRRQLCGVEVTVAQRCRDLRILFAPQLQEPGMAPVKSGNG
jgi:hypothetical protein